MGRSRTTGEMEQEEAPEQGMVRRNESLIPGLPHEIAILCLVRVPRAYHCNISCVSPSWRNLVHGTFFSRVRRELSLAEEWLYVWVGAEYGWRCFEPSLKRWFNIPAMPHDDVIIQHSGFGSFDGKLFVVGGNLSRSNEIVPCKTVWYFDARTFSWKRAADLNIARSKCVVATISNRLYVIGGCIGEDETNIAEVYDEMVDSWKFVSNMSFPMLMNDGVVMGEKFYGFGRGHQGIVYDAKTDTWEDIANGILDGWQGKTAVLNGKLYTVEHIYPAGCGEEPDPDYVIQVYNPSEGLWRIFHEIWSGSGNTLVEEAELVSFGGRLCVISPEKDASGVAHEALKICLVNLEVEESTEVPTCSKSFRDEFEMQIEGHHLCRKDSSDVKLSLCKIFFLN